MTNQLNQLNQLNHFELVAKEANDLFLGRLLLFLLIFGSAALVGWLLGEYINYRNSKKK